ncbi:MAG TPA: hypothetical protein VFA26_06725 [Gemmataceae bacterium]|nr:hypothetical protein [Gemmataceae bacterium]
MITIHLPPEAEKELQRRAAERGQDAAEYARQLLVMELQGRNGGSQEPPGSAGGVVSRPAQTLDEVLGPVWEGFAKSGMTDEEIEQLFEEAREEVRQERKQRKNSP